MTPVIDVDRRDEILKLVTEALKPLQPTGYRVVVKDVLQEDDWYYVVVHPDKEGVRNYDYYNVLALAEEKLQDELDKNVLLVPTVPG